MPIFDPTAIQQAVAQTLKDADLGDNTNAFVAVVTVSPAGDLVVKGVYAQKGQDATWSVGALFAIDHERHLEGGIELKASWK